MQCRGGFISHLGNGQVVTSVRCVVTTPSSCCDELSPRRPPHPRRPRGKSLATQIVVTTEGTRSGPAVAVRQCDRPNVGLACRGFRAEISDYPLSDCRGIL